VNKRHTVITDIEDTVIGDCYTTGILAQVSHQVFGFSEGRLTMHIPWFFPRGINRCFVLFQQFLFSQPALDAAHHLSAKGNTKLSYRIEIFSFFAYVFHVTCQRLASGRHNAMHMRVQAQVLSPGLKHHHRAAFHAVVRVAECTQDIPRVR